MTNSFSSPHRALALSALALALALLGAPAYAAAKAGTQTATEATKASKDSISSKQVTVYATRSPQSVFEVPAMVSQINLGGAGNALSGNMSDIFSSVPGLDMQGGPVRSAQEISIRGMSQNRLITLVDHRRQNFESGHLGRLFVDPSLLQSVEVVRGAASASYGGGAIGGVIAFETKDAADLLAPGQNVGFLASIAAGSGNKSSAPTLAAYGRSGNWDYLAAISSRKSGDIRQGGGDKLIVKDKMNSVLLKTGATLNDFHTIKVQAQLANGNSTEPLNSTQPVNKRDNLEVDKKTKDMQISVSHAFSNPQMPWLNLTTHVYHNDSKVTETNTSGRSKGRIQYRRYQTTGLTLDNQSKLGAAQDALAHTLSYGLEFYKNKQKGYRSTDPKHLRPGVPDANDTHYGLYVQDNMEMNVGQGDLALLAAARFDGYKSKTEDNKHTQKKSKFSPKISLRYRPIPAFEVFGSIASAFRAPELTELYPSGLHFPGGGPMPDNHFEANPDLKPETVNTFEIGLGSEMVGLMGDADSIQIKGSVFQSLASDFIDQKIDMGFATGAGTTSFVNINKAKLQGFQLDGKYQNEALEVQIGLSATSAKDKKTHQHLNSQVPLTLTSDISYQVPSIDSTFGWKTRSAKANNAIPKGATATKGYGVSSLYYRWSPSNGIKGLTFDFGVNNLFDKSYNKRFVSLAEEGRSVVMKLEYKWSPAS